MAISEELRLELYEALKESLGGRPATTMMELVPPVGWADVATKHDLDATALLTKRDIEALAASTNAQFRAVGTEFAAVRAEIAAEFRAVRAEMAIQTSDIRAELHKEIGSVHLALAGMQRTMFFSMLGALTIFTGILGGLIVAVN